MSDILFNSHAPVTLLGAGDHTPDDLSEALTLAPGLVAVDGGAEWALKQGNMPDAVIGDMDSLAPNLRDRIPPGRVYQIAEQDTTDFDKAMRSIESPMMLGVGFLGARVDHQLGNFAVLVRHWRAKCVLLGAHDVVFVAPPERWLTLEMAPGARVSLFPMRAVRGRSEGLVWPIDGLEMAPDGRIGTSNRTETGSVRIRADGPGLLVILPRDGLAAAWAALGAEAPR